MERKTTVCLSYSEDGCDDIGVLCTSEFICPHCGARTSHVVLSAYDFESDSSWETGVSTDCSVWIGEDPAHEVTKDAVRLERCVFFEPIVVGCNIEIFM